MNEDLNISYTKTNDYELNKEINTGQTWINNKPIYRQVFRTTTLSQDVISLNVNIEFVVNLYGFVYDSDAPNSTRIIGVHWDESNRAGSLRCLKRNDGWKINVSNVNMYGSILYIVIEYTKV